jgi:hypothetical protein
MAMNILPVTHTGLDSPLGFDPSISAMKYELPEGLRSILILCPLMNARWQRPLAGGLSIKTFSWKYN